MKKRIFRIMMVCYLVFSLSFIMSDLVRPVSVSAAAKWTDDADKSIYKGGKKDEKNVDLGDPDEEKLKENNCDALGLEYMLMRRENGLYKEFGEKDIFKNMHVKINVEI